ncbi:glycosyltransferase family 4 protein [Mucilaginibacter sp. HMF5004]|uniref:glycosyltransferase family 4 protein n=1 Tax=Mucilaginibacter rivuli TaxID=2857527 RepID=UPI001C5F2115|nr:glycosyltransferase family 4 protein [Mucilaginibacter rivuli]MBW4890163.1 glycosyltransferase family 4 protein [Mucilaginibacter rivuli]
MALKVGIIHTYYQDKGGEDAVFEMESALISKECAVQSLIFRNAGGAMGLLQFIISIWNPFSVRRAKNFIRQFNPDVIHIHNLHYAAGPAVIRAVKKLNVPMVYTLHNYRLLCPSGTLLNKKELFTNSIHAGFPWAAVRNKVFRNSAILTFWLSVINYFHKKAGTWKMIDQYTVHTSFAKETYANSSFGLPAQQFTVKPNFVKPVSTSGAAFREKHFLFIGRLAEEKGIRFLLDTFSNSGHVLKIAGDGPMKKDVLEACSHAANIQYMGPLQKEAVEKEMTTCAALIFPSIWYECMPMTLLESLSAGTPVIATRLGVMTSIITNGYNGLLVEPHNSTDLKEKLDAWTALPEAEKARFYDNCKSSYADNYTPEKNREMLLNIYSSVVKSKPAEVLAEALL